MCEQIKFKQSHHLFCTNCIMSLCCRRDSQGIFSASRITFEAGKLRHGEHTLNFEVTFKTLFDALIKYLANEYNLNYLQKYRPEISFF